MAFMLSFNGDEFLDKRLEQLKKWLENQLGLHDYTIFPASADASFRRYFRLRHNGQSFIVMDAPPEHEDCRPFIKIAELLSRTGVNVPHILQQDLEQGFLYLTDLGDRTYLPELNTETAASLYTDAMQALISIQKYQDADLPSYDYDLLFQEMDLFREWYLGKHLAVELSNTENVMLDETFEYLAQSALSQPIVIVHRDYHSRNLMISEPNPGILDFQDAVLGPVTYDLVSLLRDCYIEWPDEQITHWIGQYFTLAQQAGILTSSISESTFRRWFDLMGLQRHIKVAGIFSRLNYRDGKQAYLNDIPLTMKYIEQVSGRYAKLQNFHQFVKGLGKNA